MAPLAFTLTVLLCGTLSAQSVADRFKQLDKDGDGKLSTSEAGTLGFFKPADSNRDGLVTLQVHPRTGDDPARRSARSG